MGEWSTCVLCPRLCRTACPVATGSAREAATPTAIATVLRGWEHGRWTPAQAAWAATLCTDCGACQERCHINQPLPERLRRARARLLPAPSMEPLRGVEGEGDHVAIEADGRPLAQALAKRLDKPVRRLVTGDRLGVEAVEHPVFDGRARELRDVLGGLQVVIADGGVARVLRGAGIAYRWVHQIVQGLPLGAGSCETRGWGAPLACCGAAGPLPSHHPEDARRVGEMWLERASDWQVADARCRAHLRRCGGGEEVTDPLDQLLVEVGLTRPPTRSSPGGKGGRR